MADMLATVRDAIVSIRPDLGGPDAPISPAAALFYAEDPAAPVLGLDSMDAIELIAALERRLGVQLSTTGVRLADLHTVGDVTDALTKATAATGGGA